MESEEEYKKKLGEIISELKDTKDNGNYNLAVEYAFEVYKIVFDGREKLNQEIRKRLEILKEYSKIIDKKNIKKERKKISKLYAKIREASDFLIEFGENYEGLVAAVVGFSKEIVD